MVTGTDIRLVPMTREQRDWAKPDVREAYDNAPQDPREVIANALYRVSFPSASWAHIEPKVRPSWLDEAESVLRAFGWEETT